MLLFAYVSLPIFLHLLRFELSKLSVANVLATYQMLYFTLFITGNAELGTGIVHSYHLPYLFLGTNSGTMVIFDRFSDYFHEFQTLKNCIPPVNNVAIVRKLNEIWSTPEVGFRTFLSAPHMP